MTWLLKRGGRGRFWGVRSVEGAIALTEEPSFVSSHPEEVLALR